MKSKKSHVLSDLPSRSTVTKIKKSERMVYYHFYNPMGIGDWYALAGDKVEGDILFYGLVHFTSTREDTFLLSELENKKLPFGFKIIRNKKFKKMKLGQLLKSLELP